VYKNAVVYIDCSKEEMKRRLGENVVQQEADEAT
jgi:deoxyadenosine/deoxycytidine kinase